MYNSNTTLPWILNTLPYSLPEEVPLVAIVKDKLIPIMIVVSNSEAQVILDDDVRGYGWYIDLCDIISYIQVAIKS